MIAKLNLFKIVGIRPNTKDGLNGVLLNTSRFAIRKSNEIDCVETDGFYLR